jgi:Uma2 family endonuclease
MTTLVSTDSDLLYPDSDGQPMSDNTKQFRWIVVFKENLEILFADRSDVFVAGDLLWYAVEGRPDIRVAPDTMVVLGRPKGDRGSYKQWQEDNIAPQVVFEILSPGNTVLEMSRKLLFYQRYGVLEYYVFDPDRLNLAGYIRTEGGNSLEEIAQMQGWVSPLLGIRFELMEDDLTVYRPDEARFLTSVELHERAEQEYQRAEQEYQRAELERQRADTAQDEVHRLTARLQELGVDSGLE